MTEEAFYRPFLNEVGSDILLTKFMVPDFVEILLESCKALNSWEPNKSDRRYYTHDIHLRRELEGYYQLINDHLKSYVWPAVSIWWQTEHFYTTDMFAVRYTMDTQTSLASHSDSSFISGAVKLNTGYEGAELEFVTKDFNNSHVEVGDLLIWPGKITHPHRSRPLLSGEKHSLIIWTEEGFEDD